MDNNRHSFRSAIRFATIGLFQFVVALWTLSAIGLLDVVLDGGEILVEHGCLYAFRDTGSMGSIQSIQFDNVGWCFDWFAQLYPMTTFALPVWPFPLLVGGVTLWSWWKPIRAYRRRLNGMCPQCGYDLRATTCGRCPECGSFTCSPPPIDWRASALRYAGRCLIRLGVSRFALITLAATLALWGVSFGRSDYTQKTWSVYLISGFIGIQIGDQGWDESWTKTEFFGHANDAHGEWLVWYKGFIFQIRVPIWGMFLALFYMVAPWLYVRYLRGKEKKEIGNTEANSLGT